MKRYRLLVALAALALVFAACTEAGDTTTTEAADNGDAGEDDGAAGDGTLAEVQARGELNCGVNDVLPGFGVVDEAGEFSGFDVDICRAIAAAVLGDPDAVNFSPHNTETRLTALQAGEIDVLSRNTTFTATRDGAEGLTFVTTTFYDGQGIMVPASTGFTEFEDLQDANVCVLPATTTELNLTAVFGERGIAFNPVPFGDSAELQAGYEAGQCEVWTSDRSQLASFKFAIEEAGGDEQFIMEEVMSKEPLGPVVLDGDSQWAQIVDWTVLSLIQAWEFELTSDNIGAYDGEESRILNFVGADGYDPGLGLPSDVNVTIIEAVGNYQEIYDRHITPLGIPLEGSLNDLYTNGGLMYAPPY